MSIKVLIVDDEEKNRKLAEVILYKEASSKQQLSKQEWRELISEFLENSSNEVEEDLLLLAQEIKNIKKQKYQIDKDTLEKTQAQIFQLVLKRLNTSSL